MQDISEDQYEASLQGITFSLTENKHRYRFVITKKALADYFQAEHSTPTVVALFNANRERISEFAARIKDICPLHQNGYKLIDLETCRKYSL